MEERSTKVSQVLQQLAGSLNAMMGMLEETLSIIRPPSTQTLPTVTATLSGVVQAAETAALAVLDEAEALQGDQQDLDRAIVKLRGHLPAENAANADALAVLDEVARCSKAFADRAMKFMAAMEFQDLASQHINRVTTSIEEVRERLARVLSLFDLQHPEVAVALAPAGADAIGDPTRRHGAGQALADQLLAERG